MRAWILLLALVAALGGCKKKEAPAAPSRPAPTDHLDAVGPTLVSNQTSYPIYLYGVGFRPGDRVTFRGPFELHLAAAFIDSGHLALRLEPQKLPPAIDSVLAHVTVQHADGQDVPGEVLLTVVNDASFAEPYTCALTPDGSQLFVASPTTDEIYRYETTSGKRDVLPGGDAPRALAVTPDGSTLAVADEYASALRLIPLSGDGGAPRDIALGGWPQDLLLQGSRAWVTTRQDELLEVDLGSGAVARHALPGRQPRALVASGPDSLFISNLGTEDVLTYPGLERIAPGPGVRIVGGHTAPFSKYVMGGKAARALAYDPVHQLVFASNIGPNIGPNPQRMEVSMNGGIEVIDAKSHAILLHRGLGVGVPEGLAIDPKRSVLFAADLALGRIIAFDTGKLRSDPEHAVLGELKLQPPEGTPHIRPDSDFNTEGRAGIEIHTGPRALCLDAKRARLYSVNRLAGTVSVIDVRQPKQMKLAATFDGPQMWNQKERRLGDILYFSDVGRSSMSCDSCHLEGHATGVLFEKTHPLRIYRVSTLLGIRDSAPYFTPSALANLDVVARDVLGRNRFHNPDPTNDEVHALGAYQALLTNPPNPNVGPDGAPRKDLLLPDGHHGNAVHGMELFESQQVGCSASLCHPRPTFSADQDPRTRNHFNDVGTPVILPLRPELQEPAWRGWPPPPLVGTWDVFPLLQSGAGGLAVEGDKLVPAAPFAHRAVLEMRGGRPHGSPRTLTPQEKDDLLAYLLSL